MAGECTGIPFILKSSEQTASQPTSIISVNSPLFVRNNDDVVVTVSQSLIESTEFALILELQR